MLAPHTDSMNYRKDDNMAKRLAYASKKYLCLTPATMTVKFLENFKETLKLGRWYSVLKVIISDSWAQQKTETKVRLIEIHPRVATFEDENGITMSFDYWKIYKLLRKEEAIE